MYKTDNFQVYKYMYMYVVLGFWLANPVYTITSYT